jgi:hypothetical protein
MDGAHPPMQVSRNSGKTDKPAYSRPYHRGTNPFNVCCRDAWCTGRIYLLVLGFFDRDGHRTADEKHKRGLMFAIKVLFGDENAILPLIFVSRLI